MHGHVLVAFLESVVLFDVVQVISPDNHGPAKKFKKYISKNSKLWKNFFFRKRKKKTRTFEEMDGKNYFFFGGYIKALILIFPNFKT